MRILLASIEDVTDVKSWSGTPHHMHRALLDAGVDVVTASPLRERLGLPLKAIEEVRNRLGRSHYSRLREPLVLRGYAEQIRVLAVAARPDVILAPSTIPLARLDLDVPTVSWTDATFAGLLDYNPVFTGLSRRYRALGHAMEREALRRVSRAVYTSEWAARTAMDAYGVPQERVAVVPFGANFARVDAHTHAVAGVGNCRLLLVGRGWFAKGVDRAVETASRLRSIGVPAVLDVVGCRPPEGTDVPGFVTVHGALEKDDPGQSTRLRQLYQGATFFVLPTRSDCTPVVLAEAQAHAVPVVVADTGGTASMLRRGRSGFLVGPDRFAEDAAAAIASVWAEPAAFADMQHAARSFYEERLNWPRAVRRLLEILPGP